jgi:hypothetical protein
LEIPKVTITNGSRGGRWAKSSSLTAIEQQSRRWIEHLQNRIAYEKAMLGEAGGIAAAQFTIEVGGRVLVADEWVVVLKLNRVGGTLNSVSTTPLRRVQPNAGPVPMQSYRVLLLVVEQKTSQTKQRIKAVHNKRKRKISP